MSLDLTAATVSLWRGKLPGDFQMAVPDDATPDMDEAASAVALALRDPRPETVIRVVEENAAVIGAMGSARRTRMLAWITARNWRTAGDTFRAVVKPDADDEGAAGRRALAPLFAQDIAPLREAGRSRILRAAIDHETVAAVAGGIRNYESTLGLSRGGL